MKNGLLQNNNGYPIASGKQMWITVYHYVHYGNPLSYAKTDMVKKKRQKKKSCFTVICSCKYTNLDDFIIFTIYLYTGGKKRKGKQMKTVIKNHWSIFL